MKFVPDDYEHHKKHGIKSEGNLKPRSCSSLELVINPYAASGTFSDYLRDIIILIFVIIVQMLDLVITKCLQPCVCFCVSLQGFQICFSLPSLLFSLLYTEKLNIIKQTLEGFPFFAFSNDEHFCVIMAKRF